MGGVEKLANVSLIGIKRVAASKVNNLVHAGSIQHFSKLFQVNILRTDLYLFWMSVKSKIGNGIIFIYFFLPMRKVILKVLLRAAILITNSPFTCNNLSHIFYLKLELSFS